jgi:hypothetical protein
MITASDSFNTVDMGKYYAILPAGAKYSIREYCEKAKASLVEQGFFYNSGSNEYFLTVDELRDLIQTHVGQSYAD